MDERHEQFFIAVGDLCVSAALAALVVELRTALGQRVCGIPSSVRYTKGRDEVDDTGYGRWFQIDKALVRLDEIVKCTVSAPTLEPARHLEKGDRTTWFPTEPRSRPPFQVIRFSVRSSSGSSFQHLDPRIALGLRQGHCHPLIQALLFKPSLFSLSAKDSSTGVIAWLALLKFDSHRVRSIHHRLPNWIPEKVMTAFAVAVPELLSRWSWQGSVLIAGKAIVELIRTADRELDTPIGGKPAGLIGDHLKIMAFPVPQPGYAPDHRCKAALRRPSASRTQAALQGRYARTQTRISPQPSDK